MTREEAIEIFEQKGWWIAQKETFTSKQAEEIIKLNDAVNFALSALRPISRERVEKVWRGCYTCDEYKYFMFNAWTNPESSERPDCMGTSLFCPHCGKPLTDEAVDIMLERFEAIQNDHS